MDEVTGHRLNASYMVIGSLSQRVRAEPELGLLSTTPSKPTIRMEVLFLHTLPLPVPSPELVILVCYLGTHGLPIYALRVVSAIRVCVD